MTDTATILEADDVAAEPTARSGVEPFSALHKSLLAAAAILSILLRALWLQSDAYPRLSWSSALLTDEGFYIHNARNLVLFGRLRTDEFNNMLIMPLLHLAQVVVFKILGVGLVQARLISVVAGLLTVVILGDTLRRMYGARVAMLGILLFGLDHVLILYSRLALMDTPAALLVVSAFWCLVRSTEDHERQIRWLYLTSVFLVLAYTTRGFALLVLAGPLWAMRRDGRAVMALLKGAGASLAIYGLLWWLPHAQELRFVNHYYIDHQLLPHSLHGFWINIREAVVGDARGVSSFLWRHNAVWFMACLLWFAAGRPAPAKRRELCDCLSVWFVLLFLLFSVVSYSPSRYYVLFYPAMASISAIALARAGTVVRLAWERRGAISLILGFMVFHVARSVLYYVGRTPDWLLYCLAAIVGCVCWAWPRTGKPLLLLEKAVAVVALAIWTTVNVGWLTDWVMHISYRQLAACNWLEENLPPGSVLFGDLAPGLCTDNHITAVNVIAGLCNDRAPIERFAGRPRYVVILDNGWKERYWLKHYPDLVETEHRMHEFHGILRPFFIVGIYPVPQDYRHYGSTTARPNDASVRADEDPRRHGRA